jgi:hypothetical protein
MAESSHKKSEVLIMKTNVIQNKLLIKREKRELERERRVKQSFDR